MDLRLSIFLTCSYLFYLILDQQQSKSWQPRIPPQHTLHNCRKHREALYSETPVWLYAIAWRYHESLHFISIVQLFSPIPRSPLNINSSNWSLRPEDNINFILLCSYCLKIFLPILVHLILTRGCSSGVEHLTAFNPHKTPCNYQVNIIIIISHLKKLRNRVSETQRGIWSELTFLEQMLQETHYVCPSSQSQ